VKSEETQKDEINGFIIETESKTKTKRVTNGKLTRKGRAEKVKEVSKVLLTNCCIALRVFSHWVHNAGVVCQSATVPLIWLCVGDLHLYSVAKCLLNTWLS
jgi:hypothetical protein